MHLARSRVAEAKANVETAIDLLADWALSMLRMLRWQNKLDLLNDPQQCDQLAWALKVLEVDDEDDSLISRLQKRAEELRAQIHAQLETK